jgi:hypothetical protein
MGEGRAVRRRRIDIMGFYFPEVCWRGRADATRVDQNPFGKYYILE